MGEIDYAAEFYDWADEYAVQYDHEPLTGCPHCGEVMVLRTNRTTQAQFYGCVRYPACTGSCPVAQWGGF